jgi:pyruvate-ferredoxin/flavodoxin oxidoreductase
VAEHLGGTAPAVTGGRFGLSSKELTPAMIERVFFELDALEPKRHFTLGIRDDVSRSSLDGYAAVDNEPSGTVAALVYGRGSDGTVSACHSTLRIVGEDGDPPRAVQGYFVYDSHKSGTVTVSHLRFSDSPIEAPYLVQRARFIGIHQWSLLERFDVLDRAADDGLVLVNAPLPAEQVWDRLPREAQEQLIARRMQLFAIDAQAIARELGLGARIGTIMQACFFAVAGLLPVDRAVTRMREEIGKSYQARGAEVIEKNRRALSLALERLASIPIPDRVTATRSRPPIVAHEAPRFVQRVTALMLAGKGDLLPVSAFPPDGTWPTGTARWEKRDLAQEIPVWNSDSCIQCNKCATVCPHAAIRAKVYPSEALVDAPAAFQSVPFRSKELRDRRYTIQVAPEDCTGCALCVAICPAHDGGNGAAALAMTQEPQRREAERACFEYFLELPEIDRREVRLNAKHVQLLEPLFEFPGACAGCGEAPYLKLLTQLFGDRMLIANATGCSSIYGGNLPTTPYTSDRQGRGPAWANSLFEDNAEFGVGMRLAVDRARDTALQLVRELRGELGDVGHELITAGSEDDEAAISAQRARVRALRALLAHVDRPEARTLEALADYLVPKTVWIVGGDGWAYDIGFGGLDHVLASGEDVNVLVLDTECYSNTGGQTSKATPLGAVAKFSARGKASPKKDLALLAMSYGDVYVARVAFGADDQQTVKALLEAQSYRGPSLVIAYSHCIAQGYDLREALDHQRLAVDSGHWPLFRHDPRRRDGGLAALQLDSRARASFDELARREDRFRSLASADPERAGALLERAQRDAEQRGELYRLLATLR